MYQLYQYYIYGTTTIVTIGCYNCCRFLEGEVRCLVATDVAARGLDILEVDLVVECEPPKVFAYLHMYVYKKSDANMFLNFSNNRQIDFMVAKKPIAINHNAFRFK